MSVFRIVLESVEDEMNTLRTKMDDNHKKRQELSIAIDKTNDRSKREQIKNQIDSLKDEYKSMKDQMNNLKEKQYQVKKQNQN